MSHGKQKRLLWIHTGLHSIGVKRQRLCIQQGLSLLSPVFYHSPTLLYYVTSNTYWWSVQKIDYFSFRFYDGIFWISWIDSFMLNVRLRFRLHWWVISFSLIISPFLFLLGFGAPFSLVSDIGFVRWVPLYDTLETIYWWVGLRVWGYPLHKSSRRRYLR